MDLETLTQFFMWCTILSVGLFFFWLAFIVLTPDLVYRLQSKFFPITREAYDVVIYSFMGLFKVLILVFVVIPYVALLIMG